MFQNQHAIIARMDIHAGVIVLALFAVIGAYFAIRAAIAMMQTARKMSFYSLRRQHNARAWRLFFLSMLLVGLAIWLPFYGEPMAYVYFPPSLTPSVTPTITITPTVTLTQTITTTPTLSPTPLESSTPTATTTPFLPLSIEALFAGPVTPNPEAAFSPLQFSTQMNNGRPVAPRTVFELPIKTMYGSFAYNNTLPDAQWTALWYRNGELVDYETKPWDGGTGGIGYTDSTDPIGGWVPGTYEVQIFMGYDWMTIGRFVVLGELTTSTPARTPTRSLTPTP
jgi:hypothetical protein